MRTRLSFPHCIPSGAVLGAVCMLVFVGCVYKRAYQASRNSVHTNSGGAVYASNQIEFAYVDRDGLAVLETELWTLEFEGLSGNRRRCFHFSGDRLSVQVAGSGRSSVNVHCRRNAAALAFESRYAEGTNTVTFGESTFRLTDRGRTLLVGDERIEAGAERKALRWTFQGRLTIP